jgi:hypothetical protein
MKTVPIGDCVADLSVVGIVTVVRSSRPTHRIVKSLSTPVSHEMTSIR